MADQIVIINLPDAHRGCGQSTFQREVCKTMFSGTLKHQKANRLLTLGSLESSVSAMCLCVLLSPLVSIIPSVSVSLSHKHLSYSLFSLNPILAGRPRARPDQIKQFKALYLLLLFLSSVDCSLRLLASQPAPLMKLFF